MNVLFIENSLDPNKGGVERVTYVLTKGLSNLGYKCFVAFTNDNSDWLHNDYKLQLPLSGYREWQNILTDFIRNNDISIIIVQNKYSKWQIDVYDKLKKTIGVRVVSVLHCNPDIWINKNKWSTTFTNVYLKDLLKTFVFYLFGNRYINAQKGMYNVADKYVLLSEKFIPIFKKTNKIEDKNNKLTYIHNPCSFSYECEDSFKENIVLVVARMAEQQKRISNVLWIWERLHNRHKDWKLVIVGDGPDLKKYKLMAKKMGLDRITFCGACSNPEKYYEKSKIFLMTSIWEGYPMTLIEAQHYGCIPFAFDSFAAVYDIIDSGKNGFVISLHDIEGYVSRLDDLMENDILIHNMSVNAELFANKKSNTELIINNWDALLRNLM